MSDETAINIGRWLLVITLASVCLLIVVGVANGAAALTKATVDYLRMECPK